MAASPTPTPSMNMRDFLARITRDQGPEFEQTIPFVNLNNVATPTALKTDRKIKVYDFHLRGRITVGAGAVTFRSGPPLLGTPLFSLFQQISITGQHNRFGAQTPFIMRGETIAELFALMYPNWSPTFSVSVNGGALTRGQALSNAANATNDFDITLPLALYPLGVSPGDQVFYCLHGPDWAGNLYANIAMADPTALGVTIASLANGGAVTSFGAATGAGTVDILSERPLLSKQLMARIKPALTFRITDAQQITTLLSTGAAGADQKLRDLTVGKDTTRVFTKVGTSLAGTSAGVVAFGSLSDAIVTRTLIKLDDRALRFGNSNSDLTLQDYLGRGYGRTIPVGYKLIDFIAGSGQGYDNLKAAFASSNLSAARKFQLNGDVASVAANQIGEVVQEMTLSSPQLN